MGTRAAARLGRLMLSEQVGVWVLRGQFPVLK